MFLLYLCAFPAAFYFVNLMYNVQRPLPAFACPMSMVMSAAFYDMR